SLGGLSAEQGAEQVPLLRLAPTGELAQASRATPAGSDRPVDLRHSPTRPAGCDHEVAAERQLKASTGADTVNRGNRDRDQIVDQISRLLVLTDLPHSDVPAAVGPRVELL